MNLETAISEISAIALSLPPPRRCRSAKTELANTYQTSPIPQTSVLQPPAAIVDHRKQASDSH